MPDRPNQTSPRTLISRTVIVIIAIIAVLVAASWILTRGVEDDKANVPGINNSGSEQPLPANPTEPANPNVTGGSSGAGTGTSNEPAAETPSPAGGVDTNQVPAGGTSPPQ